MTVKDHAQISCANSFPAQIHADQDRADSALNPRASTKDRSGF
jgi:hypothetical protein